MMGGVWGGEEKAGRQKGRRGNAHVGTMHPEMGRRSETFLFQARVHVLIGIHTL